MRILFTLLLLRYSLAVSAQQPPVRPFVLGEIHTLFSAALGENRVLNIYLPRGYTDKDTVHYPVIYLLDGSADEDFIHVAGLLQFLSFPWVNKVEPSILVGIANVDRRRDFTFPSRVPRDRAANPTSGHADRFSRFLSRELRPFIDRNFRTSGKSTLIGESLGGLLATRILLTQPDLFQAYVIVSPSLWWDNGSMLERTTTRSSADTGASPLIYHGSEKKA